MNRKNKVLTFAASLRQKAERLLQRQDNTLELPENTIEIEQLRHEYQIQKKEVVLLKAALQKASKETKLAKEKFHSLYDFAPTSYFTFTIDGEITSLNMSGARLLGYERNELINKNIQQFIAEDSLPVFTNFLKEIFTVNTKISCELMLTPHNNLPIFAILEGVINNYGEKCLVTVIDITDRKKAEGRIIEREKNAHNPGWPYCCLFYLDRLLQKKNSC